MSCGLPPPGWKFSLPLLLSISQTLQRLLIGPSRLSISSGRCGSILFAWTFPVIIPQIVGKEDQTSTDQCSTEIHPTIKHYGLPRHNKEKRDQNNKSDNSKIIEIEWHFFFHILIFQPVKRVYGFHRTTRWLCDFISIESVK